MKRQDLLKHLFKNKCVFIKKELGSGTFTEAFDWRDKEMPRSADVDLPSNTFSEWKTQDKPEDVKEWEFERIIRKQIETKEDPPRWHAEKTRRN